MNFFHIEEPVNIFDDPNIFIEKYLNINRDLEISQHCNDLKNQIQIEVELRICDLKETNNIDVNQENESKLPCVVLENIKDWIKQKEILIEKINDYENDLLKSGSLNRKKLTDEINQLNVFFKFFWNHWQDRFSKNDYNDIELKKAKNKTKKYQFMLNSLQLKCIHYVFNNNKIELEFRNSSSSLYESSLNFNPIGSKLQNEIGYLYLNKVIELKNLYKIDLKKILIIKNNQKSNFEFEIFDNSHFFILQNNNVCSKLYIYDSCSNKISSKIIEPHNQLKKINNKIFILANNAVVYVIDQQFNILQTKLSDSYSLIGNDESYLYFVSTNNDCKILDLNLKELEMTDENKFKIPIVQNKDQESPFYAENEMTEFIKMSSKYYIKRLANKSDSSNFMNVYSKNGDLLQSINSVYSKNYVDTFEFKIDSKGNLLNILNNRLRFFDSSKGLVQNILFLKDFNLFYDIKYCIDKTDKMFFLLELTIYYE